MLLFITLINFYRYFISPIIPARCRYYPTCSDYAIKSLEIHGVIKGLYFTVCRLFRCHPFSKREYYDPVPSKINKVKVKNES